MAEKIKKYLDDHGLKIYHGHIDNAFKAIDSNIENINNFIIANLGENTFKDTPESWLDGWYFDQTGILEPQPSWVSTPKILAYPGNTITVAWHDETVDKVIAIRVNIWNNETYLGFKNLNDYNSFVMPPGATHYALSINKANITATERHPKLYIMIDDPLTLQLKKIKQNTKAVTYFGISETAADDGNKQVNIPDYNPDDLTDGLQVNVLFKNGNTADPAQLYINNTSSGFIAFGKISDSHYKTYGGNEWNAGDLVTFTYVNPYWILDNHIATTSTYGYTKLDNTLTDSEKTVPTTKLLKDTTDALVYGKVQSIGTINDLNNLVQTGFYIVEKAKLANAPNTSLNRYNVTVTSYTRYIIQEAVGVIGSTTSSSAKSNVLIYYRMKDTFLGEWTVWKRIADMDDIDDIEVAGETLFIR